MKFSWSEPGVVISFAVHATILLATLLAFSSPRKFDDAQEAVPVETISDSQFNQMMRGEKKAKEAPQPHPKVEKVADAEVQKPKPPTPDAKVDVPTPPPPLKRTADPGPDDLPEAPKPEAPKPVAALPPPRPEPAKLEPLPPPQPPVPTPPVPAKSQPEAKKPPPPPKPDAETIENAAKPTPKTEAPAKPPLPPVKPRPVEKKEEAKPKTEPKPLRDVAKLLEEKRLEELAAAEEKPPKPVRKPPSKPKSGDEQAKPTRRPDYDAIKQLISHEDPQSTGSTGRQLNKVASLGSPNADALKMTPSMLNELDDVLLEQYKACWIHSDTQGKNFVTVIVAEYNRDGTLHGEPLLQNPPSDPALRVLAESALDAVRKCNPLRIPAQFQPYYNYWKGPRGLRFDPSEMSG